MTYPAVHAEELEPDDVILLSGQKARVTSVRRDGASSVIVAFSDRHGAASRPFARTAWVSLVAPASEDK